MNALCHVMSSADAYESDVASLSHLNHGLRNVVVCGRVSKRLRNAFPDIEFRSPEKSCRGLRRFRWYAKTVACIIANSKSDWVIVESGSAFTLALLRPVVSRKRASLVHLALTPSLDVWRQKGWERDNFGGSLSFRHRTAWRVEILQQVLGLRLATKVCDGIIGNSQQIIDEVRSLGFRRPIALVPNSISNFVDVPYTERRRDQFTMVAAKQPYKAFGSVFEAMRLVLPDNPQVELHLAGRTSPVDIEWYKRLCGAYADIQHAIVDHGQVSPEQLKLIYQRSTALVHPSLFEGSPRVIFEALANGCPVFASDIPGNRGIVDNEWVTYFPPQDAASIAQMMMSATQCRTKPDMSSFAAEFSHASRADKLAQFCSELLG